MQGLSAILKSCPRINRQSTFTYELFSPLNKDTQVLSAILHVHKHNKHDTMETGKLESARSPLVAFAKSVTSYDFIHLFCNLDSEETEAKPNSYCCSKVRRTQGHSYFPAKLLQLLSNPIMPYDIFVSL